ncbi:MAG: hypothetical protein SFX74_10755 [Fimbriimonadaceae bacterium]|nr:hypothetical protein [Fimbriimonadaceae bacterium]
MKINATSLAFGALAITLIACTGGAGGGSATESERDRSYRAWNLLTSEVAADFQIDNLTLEAIAGGTASGNDIAYNTPSTRSKFYRSTSQEAMRVQNANNSVTFFSGNVAQTSADRQLMTAFGPGTAGSVNHVINMPFESRSGSTNSITVAHLSNPATSGAPTSISLHVAPTGAAANASNRRITDVRYDLSNPFNMRKYVNLDTIGTRDIVITNNATGAELARVSVTFEDREYLFVAVVQTGTTFTVRTYSELYG